MADSMTEQRKPMDIKALLAFAVLIGIVLLLPKYWEWIGYEKPEPVPVEQADTTWTPAIGDAPATIPTDQIESAITAIPDDNNTLATGSFRQDPAWTEEYVLVETELYDAILSTRGARVVRLVLKSYKYTDNERRGEPIVIIDSTDNAGPRFRFFQDKLDWSAAPFSVSTRSVTVRGGDSTDIRFTVRTRSGNELSVTYTFFGDHHDFGMSFALDQPWEEGLEKEYLFGWEGGLRPTEPDPKSDNDQFAAVALMGEDLETIGEINKEEPRTSLTGLTHWAAVRTRYFMCATIPRGREADGFLAVGRERPIRVDGELLALREHSSSVRVDLPMGAPLDERFTIYVGPVEYDLLKSYGVGLEELVDLGWKWLVRPFSLMILWMFKALHGVIPNYGLVIILFSLLIKVIFHPLTKKSMRSMRRMQSLQPRMEKLKERFKGDSTRLNQEMMKLYKEMGINPISGCLPLLPQMPIFYGLFQVFRTTIELRGAPFFGWLTDLSLKDPYYILPIIMTLSFFLQQRLSTKDPKQKMLTYVLPLVFGFLFKDFPAGLTLYWTMYNIFSVVEQTWLIGHPEPVAVTDAGNEVGSGKIVKTRKKGSRPKK
jgi:YidC/Oxa1 family membrane protein insertase